MNILIVDDNSTNRKLLRAVLEFNGFTVLVAGDGAEALEVLEQKPVDAIISDLLMPRMDGYRLCHEVRSRDRFRDLPIIIYSATYLSPADRKLALDMGADEFVAKPAAESEILEALRQTAVRGRVRERADAHRPISDLSHMKEYSERLVAKLEEKNIELEERIQLAALSAEVGQVLTQAGTLLPQLQLSIDILVRYRNVAFARLWTLNQNTNELELEVRAGISKHRGGADGLELVGKFVLRRIAENGRPHLRNDVPDDPEFSDPEWAKREEIVALAAYPLKVTDRVVGVIAVFGRLPFGPAMLETFAAVTVQLAQCIARKRAEEQLLAAKEAAEAASRATREVLERLDMALKGSRTGVWTWNTASGVIDWDATCYAIFGVAPGSFGGALDSFAALLHPEDRERVFLDLQQSSSTSPGFTSEFRVIGQDGGIRHLALRGQAFYNGAGFVTRRTGVIHDITAQRQLAEQQAANQAKSAFLSTMSHEIRTPLNAILGYAQLMTRDPALSPETKANLKIIASSGEHLLSLINDVLDMSKIEAGRADLNPITFNLHKLLSDLAAMFRLRAEAKGLRFEMSMEGERVPYVLADQGKIRQALINLLGNAIKFTNRGQLRLHVILEPRDDRLWLSVRVEDTGSGIADEEQSQLFEPFRQAKQGLNAQEGTGLGLAISRKHARLMGGDITVASTPGVGSIFRFEIPIERGDAAVAVRRSSPRRVIGLRAGTKAPNVLVVDDQFESRDWLSKLLTAVGFSVREAENGEAAIRNWEEWRPELILMDVHMPVMDGLEATRRIKSDPRGKGTVIVVLTASAMEEDRRTVTQSQADQFLSKPCREDDLLETVRSLLNLAYNYDEIYESEDQPLHLLEPLTADRLGRLPRELIEELLEATLNGNKRLLDEMIIQVRDGEDPVVAHALREMADKYDYEALTRLLERVCRR